MANHRHREKTSSMTGWQHCVARGSCSGAAHGAVTLISRCACGAVRKVESNGRHQESSGWYEDNKTATMRAVLLTDRGRDWETCIEPDGALTIRDGGGQGRILYHWDGTAGTWCLADPVTTNSR